MPEPSTAGLLAILERLPISAVISSAGNGRILWTNSRNLELAGATSSDQIVGRVLLDFIEPIQHATALRDIEAVANGESPPAVVYHLRGIDGSDSDVQIMTTPLVFNNEPAMLSLVADVTARERALRALAESEERYRQLVETSPDGIVVAVDDTIVYLNPALATALGAKDAAELVGRSMFDYIDPAYHKAVRNSRKQLYLGTASMIPAAEVVLTRVDGSPLPTTAQSTRVTWKGDIATQTLMHDIAGG